MSQKATCPPGERRPPVVLVLTASEASQLLRVCDRTGRRLMRSGALGAFRLGGKIWRTTPALVEEYIRESLAKERRERLGNLLGSEFEESASE
jgi:excisionase family DNA binding protein